MSATTLDIRTPAIQSETLPPIKEHQAEAAQPVSQAKKTFQSPWQLTGNEGDSFRRMMFP